MAADPVERRRANWRRYRARDPEKHRERSRRYYRENRDKERARADAYRRAHLDQYSAYARKAERKRHEADPEARLRKPRRGEARRRGSHVEDIDLAYEAVLRRDPCSYCGGEGGEIDHIDAVSEGGGWSFSNLTAACRSCNAAKGPRPLLLSLLAREGVMP